MRHLILLVWVLLCVGSCGRRSSVPVVATESAAVFLPALPPADMQGEELLQYMQEHYWDRFNFADTLFLSRADTTQMLDAYAAYVATYINPAHPAPFDSLMRRAAVSKPMLSYFQMLGEQILHDPNSPLRNDELYIIVLRTLLDSPWYDQWERIAPEHDLRLAMQNRVGEAANDFRYTLASGAQGTLYGIRADYTLLFISNPGCPMCSQIKQEIQASPRLNELIERGELKVLVIYIDEDIDEWRAHTKDIPAAWINGYDKGCVIREKELYDQKAIPALYLLDRTKRVLLKDSTSVPDIEETIDRLL